jgi:hypothetical protein
MQDLFELSNLNLYNTIEKTAVAQSTPRGNFTQHAKRYQKIASYIRRNPPYSLWRNIFNSLVLPKTQTSNNEIFCSVGLYARNNSFITDDKRQ